MRSSFQPLERHARHHREREIAADVVQQRPSGGLLREQLGEPSGDAEAREQLVRDIQYELKRAGCYEGDVSGAWNNNTFGTQVFSTTYDPDMFRGWFTRPMDWQLGTSVQRQIVNGMSVEVGYHRRWIDTTLLQLDLSS